MSVYNYSTGIKVTFDKKITSADPISISGWTVQALEPNMSPEGTLSLKTYTISKITKADDDFAVIIWLSFPDHRLKYPVGDITVKFTGTLLGPAGSLVDPFELSFTPTQPAKIFNPHAPEYVEVADLEVVTSNLFAISYAQAQDDQDAYTTVIDVEIITATLTHIDDIET